VPAPGIVEALDVVEHVGLGLVACSVRLACPAFGLQRDEERSAKSDGKAKSTVTDFAYRGTSLTTTPQLESVPLLQPPGMPVAEM
jgi:hypothetical protein